MSSFSVWRSEKHSTGDYVLQRSSDQVSIKYQKAVNSLKPATNPLLSEYKLFQVNAIFAAHSDEFENAFAHNWEETQMSGFVRSDLFFGALVNTEGKDKRKAPLY